MKPNQGSLQFQRRLQRNLSRFLLPGALLIALACSDRPMSTEPSLEPSGGEASGAVSSAARAREVTIDFTSYGDGKLFEPGFYRSEGIVFPPERCGAAGCEPWFVGFIQGDAALAVEETRFGPVTATFTRPISSLSLRVAPALQGTARYTLSAFAASGKLVATTSVTITQDFGDPANTGFGYVTIDLTNLPRPAKSFTLTNVFLRSTFPLNDHIPYGVRSISYTLWGKHRTP